MENQQDELKQAEEARTEGPEIKAPGVSRGKVFLGLALGAVVIIGASVALRRSPPGTPSDAKSAEITLVTSDRADVECVAAGGPQDFRCGYSSETSPWQGDEKIKLKPYYTVDRHLYLIPGLFLQPALVTRYQAEPPTKPREQLKRFTARCQIKVIGKVAGVKTRWLVGSPWSTAEDADVATVSDCKVEG